MSYRVNLTETAKQDLREIVLYIAEQSKDKEIARSFANELRENAAALPIFHRQERAPKIMCFAVWNIDSFRIRIISSSIRLMRKRKP